MTTQHTPTPTLDKIKEVHEESEAIGAFLDWGQEHGLFMCRYNHDREYYYFAESIDDLLHLYFGIDAKEEERERRAILAAVNKLAKEGEA